MFFIIIVLSYVQLLCIVNNLHVIILIYDNIDILWTLGYRLVKGTNIRLVKRANILVNQNYDDVIY